MGISQSNKFPLTFYRVLLETGNPRRQEDLPLTHTHAELISAETLKKTSSVQYLG